MTRSSNGRRRRTGLGNAQTNADSGPLIPGIDTDRITGVGHQMKAPIKQGVGNPIGDAKLAADGGAERRAGKQQDAAGSARDEARRSLQKRQETDKSQEKVTRATFGTSPP